MKTYLMCITLLLVVGCIPRQSRTMLPDYVASQEVSATATSESSAQEAAPTPTRTTPHVVSLVGAPEAASQIASLVGAPQSIQTASPALLNVPPVVTREPVGPAFLRMATMVNTADKNMTTEVRNPHRQFACVGVQSFTSSEPVMKLRRDMPQDALFGDPNWDDMSCVAVMPPNNSGSSRGAPAVYVAAIQDGTYRITLTLYRYDGVHRPRLIKTLTSPELVYPYMNLTNPSCPSHKDRTEGGCMYVWPRV